MEDEVMSPYIPHKAGDLLTANDWTRLQVLIKQDIQGQIKAAMQEIKEKGVDHSEDSDKFATKDPQGWVTDLDQRYAPKVHDHEGMAAYRRYIKEFTSKLNMVLLKHNLGRFPLVDIYMLNGVPGPNYVPPTGGTDKSLKDCKILVYYGDDEADDMDLLVRVYRDRPEMLGVSLEKMLYELEIKYNGETTLEDVLNDMEEKFFEDPNDEIKHCRSPWVSDPNNRRRTVHNLREGGEWDNLRVGIRPTKIAVGAQFGPDDQRKISVAQINYHTLLISVDGTWPVPAQGTPEVPLDLMFLLRS